MHIFQEHFDGRVHEKVFRDLFIATNGTVCTCLSTEEKFIGFTEGSEGDDIELAGRSLLGAVNG